MKTLGKLLLYSAIAMSSIAIHHLSPSAIAPDHPLLPRLRASEIACPNDPSDIELLTEDASNTLVWMVKGSEGAPRTGKGGVGLDHIIYHKTYNDKKGTYSQPATHLTDIVKRLNLLENIDQNIKFQFLIKQPDKTNLINQTEVNRYKNDFVPKYKNIVLNRVAEIIKKGTKMSASTVLKHGEYNLDIESRKLDEGWVYTDGNIVIFVRSNGFIANIFPKSEVQRGFITVVTDGDEDFQQKYSREAHDEIISLEGEYQEYLHAYEKSAAPFPALTLKQFFEYKSKYANKMEVMSYNEIVSLKEFENPEDSSTAIKLGFKSAAEYYIWLGKISHCKIKIPEQIRWHILPLINEIEIETIPATYHKILLPNLNNNYKYRMFKSLTGRTDPTYDQYRDIINNLDD